MKYIIDISEDIYRQAKERNAEYFTHETANRLYEAIRNGVPLPVDYGRIIDESRITACEWNDGYMDTNAPTIIGERPEYRQGREMEDASDKGSSVPWIQCSEELPDEYHRTAGRGLCHVLVTRELGHARRVEECIFVHGKFHSAYATEVREDVVAWMYWPEPSE